MAAALNQPSQPLLVVEDFFGAGPPNAAVDVGMVASDFSNDGLQNHGYHVLATILGTFASVPSLTAGPNEVVGLFPRRVDARIVDMQATALPDGTAVENAVLRMVRDLPRRVVLNSSTGSWRRPCRRQRSPPARDQLDHRKCAPRDRTAPASRASSCTSRRLATTAPSWRRSRVSLALRLCSRTSSTAPARRCRTSPTPCSSRTSSTRRASRSSRAAAGPPRTSAATSPRSDTRCSP